MPFTTSESRRITDSIGPQTVGDRCFVHYRHMLRIWRRSTRWTTAHELYRDYVGQFRADKDEQAACELAWQVFFHKHVMPYEALKCTENGEIDF